MDTNSGSLNSEITKSPLGGLGANASRLPVVKIDDEGYILYANRASFAWLADLSFSMRKKVPTAFRHRFPCLEDPGACETIEVESENFISRIDVIGFEEEGYVGLYAVEHRIRESFPQPANNNVKGMLAD